MPAATAALMDGPSASGSGTEMASALGRLATAASISWLIPHHVEAGGRLILQPDAELAGGIVRAVGHDGPERVGRLAVTHHHDPDGTAVGGAVGVLAARRASAAVRSPRVRPRARPADVVLSAMHHLA